MLPQTDRNPLLPALLAFAAGAMIFVVVEELIPESQGSGNTDLGTLGAMIGFTVMMVLAIIGIIYTAWVAAVQPDAKKLVAYTSVAHMGFVVLGIFAGIFTYCLIVLRTIRGGDEGAFVPSLAVFFGFVMALGGVGALMFFIHHIASSIQASSIIASVAQETIAAIDRLFPEKLGHGPGEDDDDQTLRPLSERNWRAVPAR